MKSLCEVIKGGIDDREKCRILLALILRAEDRESVGSGPEEILWDSSSGELQIVSQERTDRLFFQPPEAVRTLLDGQVRAWGLEQNWYVLGMLAYWMYYQKDYFTKNELFFLESVLQVGGSPFVIQQEKASTIPFADAVSYLTAFDSVQRQHGVGKFVEYVDAHYPNLEPTSATPQSSGTHPHQSTDRTGRWLYISKAYFTRKRADAEDEVPFLSLNNQDQSNQIQVSMRFPPCQFRVVHVEENGRLRTENPFTLRKPAVPGLDEYTVRAHYNSAENSIYLEISTEGRIIRKGIRRLEARS